MAGEAATLIRDPDDWSPDELYQLVYGSSEHAGHETPVYLLETTSEEMALGSLQALHRSAFEHPNMQRKFWPR